MTEQRMYHAPGLDIRELASVVSNWFQSQKFETQVLEAPGGGFVVQARQPEAWRSILGMSSALNVTMTLQGENLIVEMGAAKWIDKAAVGAVGVLIFWPALIPAAYGAWKQKQLPSQVFQLIDQYVATGQVPVVGPVPVAAPAPAPAPSAARCPSCGQPVRAGAKFCDNCGAPLQLACPQCGAALRPGAKFCDSCGTKVG
ncbi:MAG: zinc ribbon domain-containing protein [Anaerolineae bacterium]|nr:zinc ribbon domain-containing protein [Anaerolineae bacterium]MDH7473041.1 zinc ribbon domain-containing protein [Anaerolineae bacterium]